MLHMVERLLYLMGLTDEIDVGEYRDTYILLCIRTYVYLNQNPCQVDAY